MNKTTYAHLPHLMRAYEIAQCGTYKVGVVCDEPVNEEDMKPLCKYFGFHYKTTVKVDLIKEVTLSDFLPYKGKVTHESISAVNGRVTAYRGKTFWTSLDISEAAENLLSTAMRRLDLPLGDRLTVINIARVIANMSFNDKIKVEHVAEAVMLRSGINRFHSFVIPFANIKQLIEEGYTTDEALMSKLKPYIG